MFLGYQNELIAFVAPTREELESNTNYEFTEIVETSDEYIFFDGAYILGTEVVQRRREVFEKDFIEIPQTGWFRKVPKGYSSAVEAMNTAFNAVSIVGSLTAGYLTFYVAPDFSMESQCTQEWLIEHSFKNETMSSAEFGALYSGFITVWNAQEHL